MDKPKKVSLAKVAKQYKRNTKPSGDRATLGKRTNASGAIPTTAAPRTPNTKLKAKNVTLGGTRGNKGSTTRKIGRA
jgi:hypothetical protein